MNTTAPPYGNGGDEDKTRLIAISCSVGAFLLIVVILLLILYVYKKRKESHSQRAGKNNTEPRVISENPPSPHAYPGFVYENEALQSSQVIEVGDRQHHSVVQIEPKFDHDKDFEHNVSIKLMTPWNQIYTNSDSKQFKLMKQYVQESITDLYLNFEGFKNVSLKKFRQGSVIADLNIMFAAGTVNALDLLKSAVLTGQCSQLQVDTMFCQCHPATASSNGVEIEREAEVLCLHAPNDDTERNVANPIIRSDRMESGYGSQYFDPSAVAEKLQFTKTRNSSQKSTNSMESGTSEVGTSHSISSKSCSSTNVSIHGEEVPKREKVAPLNFIQSIVKKRPRGSKLKQHATIGIPHIALFDFAPQDFRELALHQSELVTVTIIDEGGWVKATNTTGKDGWVPHNFVAPIDPKQYVETKNTVDSLMYLNGVIESMDTPADKYEDNRMKHHTYDQKSDTSDKSQDSPHSTNEIDISDLFFAIFPNDPVEANELRLEVGDLVDVLKTSETGWWKGRCLRTHEDGWFPSSYVTPHSTNLDFHKYLEDELDDKGTVSDSEIHVKTFSSLKDRDEQIGYSSDTYPENDAKSKENSASRTSSNRTSSRALKRAGKDKLDDSRIKLSDASPNAPECNTNNDVHENKCAPVLADPPSKPVPPKPRKRHMLHTYRYLAAEGKLGSTDSLVTRSTECLASAYTKENRRNSEEINTDDEDLRRSKFSTGKPIDRIRPRSFQETPKSNFFYLADRYASCMKPAWSLPTLVGDQVKLSPDDERPYLVPIPRKSRKKSSLAAVVLPNKDLSDEERETSVSLPSSPSKKLDTSYKSSNTAFARITDSSSPPKRVPTSSIDAESDTNIDTQTEITLNTQEDAPSDSNSTSGVRSNVKPSTSGVMSNVKLAVANKPVLSPKPMLPPKPLKSERRVVTHELRKPSLVSEKPVVPVRTTSKQVMSKAFIKEQLSKSSENLNVSKLNEHSHSRSNPRSRTNLRMFTVSSFESINEETEQNSFPITVDHTNTNAEHEHRRYHSEPHDGSYNFHTSLVVKEHLKSQVPRESYDIDIESDTASSEFSPRILSPDRDRVPLRDSDQTRNPSPEDDKSTKKDVLNEQTLRKHDRLTASSRTSSMQSLSSIGSSRSTASSKHEQMNLRIAIMNVFGQGTNDLSFKAGAILYELRPRNKDGYCFGLLEDSTQGFYPAEAVQTFHEV